MRFIGYAWTVLWVLVEISIALAMLYVAKSKFEGVVVAALIMIYSYVAWNHAMLWRHVTIMSFSHFCRFVELATHLRMEKTAQYLESEKELEGEMENTKVKFYIQASGISILSLIGTVAMIASVL